MKNLIRDRVLIPLKQLLNEGLAPAKMSQALAVGFVLGITPMIGISSILAVAVAAVFKLNQVAIQVANWAAYPAQILVFIPFIRLGEWIFGLDAAVINPSDIATMFNDDFQASIQLYGRSLLAGWFAWLIAAIPLAFILRWPLERALNKSFARLDSGHG
ncbi:MAG: DUF2062 domain-containing protein [Opitutae bacterium]|jgi:uncharacterized protein (DUF2062 family)